MCLFKTYETRGRTVVEPPPRRGNFTSHPPAGVMRLPREWRRSESYSDDGHFVEVRRSQPRVIEYYEEPRRSTTRHRSRSRRRISDVDVRTPRGSYVDERVVKRSVSRVRH
ncbi:hypothetical protein A1F94_002133 [Pyrenophora tritici-repentis]|uniref:Uncharacterized protein n=2 Tax=Pyrenophora tritici-repentis TaxID=45151 RepID=A0A2W1CSM1_9PLEO|nr:uncharacterized protein PTRG_11543 [Pyrenophora tritici-repentis Pt-1C-BFP]KAA8627056.1 hypothetical protein PtrV1_02736 [Pyrenophora tritici-repentis]EDU44593.1 conserved hypothetical protein [Pyrenophora tritici-repentis Pt-1C-BFP]KAF7455488.1 hypothetical protein A1F99_027460 [Pyrenophora tritici-repentis]KAF7578692.1 hypothetical protein PtrM4_029320 [Pyrenophora tritici-repentis]KAG9389240.1 hypothetical protein A1F94_002133 [Pyrenophora tritici-repentis]